MANLFSGEIEAKNFTDVETLADITFTQGNTYTMQIDGVGYIREGETGLGFIVNTNIPFQYTAGTDTLYIKTDKAVLNIAE